MTNPSFDTKIVHHKADQSLVPNSKTTPIYQTSAFTFKDLDHLESYYEGNSPYLYTRERNPNTDELAGTVAELEEAPAGVATSSGMSAILAGILAVAEPGDHIVAAEDVYGGSHKLITKELPSFGIDVTMVSFSDLKTVEDAVTEKTKLLYTESISNPFLRVEDLKELVSIAYRKGVKTMVDNTFATPYLLRPYSDGVDLVVHSGTKYIGGHSDVTCGILVGNEELIKAAQQKVVTLGANLSPFEAWLTQRGAKTLGLRMKQQSYNAHQVAKALRNHKLVQNVYYPEYVSERGHGAIVTIELDGTVDIEKFFQSLGWIKIAPTLAGVETTLSYPVRTSHRALSDSEREKIGINDYVIRLSIGIEHHEDIIHQLISTIESSVRV
ncbi:Cystathionine beta-lyase/cystathionine gamma-synthase [Halobacillus karajensis]|uniref:homocysteine desulfhydrase n=1 Tax=Halobacillus karajensis TaxID=195088 RepID=A0A024PAQ1_9BACI|nr:aminotransferase class I/II-fold pyridoxal phosphate-dependent enzyme [Halobacillus karajensis]CDQ21577.1 Cystathionine beta-lyase [Halobacillus karajensis]CDQ25512.1 Cystathionine beta-lyase [Halobacillus karajensis]CDQ28958.1 Cystathionine beta-lyase [Halobacillus karajensis]SEI08808.1 Cystathionine beta-lyase/cystathionine gamma-synthase [Halobacillus karajensis]